MAEFLRRHSLHLTSLALLVCSVQLLNFSVSNPAIGRAGTRVIDSAIVPIEKAYYEAFQSVRFLWARYVWLVGVEEERNELQRRVRELEAHNSRLMEFDTENRRLRAMLRFSDKSGLRGVAAAVIGRDPSNWVSTITIDRGSDDGLRPGLAVVDGNAVVGQLTTVTRSSGRVLLITDSTSAIDAIIQSSRANGTVEGGLGAEGLNLRYVLKLKELTVNVGDRVIASGLDGVFPKGLLIGVVKNASATTSGLFQEIEVRPSIDVHHLENVLVIVPEMSSPTSAATEGLIAMTEPWISIAGAADVSPNAAQLQSIDGACCSVDHAPALAPAEVPPKPDRAGHPAPRPAARSVRSRTHNPDTAR